MSRKFKKGQRVYYPIEKMINRRDCEVTWHKGTYQQKATKEDIHYIETDENPPSYLGFCEGSLIPAENRPTPDTEIYLGT